jgi:hypothetical protein
MQKKANKSPRRGSAWSEVSNINFGDYQLKQNRFAKRVKNEGILLVYESPSPASLKLSPEPTSAASRSGGATTPSASRQAGSRCKSAAGAPRWCRKGSQRPQVRSAAASDLEEAREAGMRGGRRVHALVRKTILALPRSAA